MSTFLRDDATFAALQGADIPAASKSDQQTGTSTTVFVTPGHQQDHDSAAKAWVVFSPGVSPSVLASYNVSGVSRVGTGDYTVSFSTAFASANYACVVTQSVAQGGAAAKTLASGSVEVIGYNSSTGTLTDSIGNIHVACYGRQ